MSTQMESRPLPELIGGLASDISGLFRKEVELAKAEASEKAAQVIGGIELLLAGAVLAIGALGVILAAIVAGLGTWFVSLGLGANAANALSALIIAIIVGIIAWVLIARGRAGIAASNLKMERTASSLGRDAAAIKPQP